MKKQISKLVFLILITIIAFSCKKEEIVKWTSYNLGKSQVTSIAIDSQGNKWVGTGGGVSKFDDTN